MSDEDFRDSVRDRNANRSHPEEDETQDRRRNALWILLILLVLLIPILAYFAPDWLDSFGLTGLSGGRQGLSATQAVQGGAGATGGDGGAAGADASAAGSGGPTTGGDSPTGGASRSDPSCSDCSQEPPGSQGGGDGALTPEVDLDQIWWGAGGGGVCGVPCTQTSDCPLSNFDQNIYCRDDGLCWNDRACFYFGQDFSEDEFLAFACGLPCVEDTDCPIPDGYSGIYCTDAGLCWLDNKCAIDVPASAGGGSGTSDQGAGTCGSACSSDANCAGIPCLFGICWDTQVCLSLLPELPGGNPNPPTSDLCTDNGGLQWQGEVCVCSGFVDKVLVCQDGTKIDILSDVPCTPDPAQCVADSPPDSQAGSPSGPDPRSGAAEGGAGEQDAEAASWECGNGTLEFGEECESSADCGGAGWNCVGCACEPIP